MAESTNEFLSYDISDLCYLSLNSTRVRQLDGEEMQELIEALGRKLWEIKNVVNQ